MPAVNAKRFVTDKFSPPNHGDSGTDKEKKSRENSTFFVLSKMINQDTQLNEDQQLVVTGKLNRIVEILNEDERAAHILQLGTFINTCHV